MDHRILLERLRDWVGLCGTVLQWFESYLHKRNFIVTLGDFHSNKFKLVCGVPQGSILGPLLFNLYMLSLDYIISKHNISYHNCANNTPFDISLPSDDLHCINSLVNCLEEINHWMAVNFLQLNREKTEILVGVLCSPEAAVQ